MLQKGFTLIELMIVVTIIGVLAGVALPQFQQYSARAKIAKSVALASSGRTIIIDMYNEYGRMPDNTEIESPGSTGRSFLDAMRNYPYASATNYTVNSDSESVIEVTYANVSADANSKTIEFLYKDDGQAIELECLGGTLTAQYRPSACR